MYIIFLNVNKHLIWHVISILSLSEHSTEHTCYSCYALPFTFYFFMIKRSPRVKPLTCPSFLCLIRQTTIPYQSRSLLKCGQSPVALHSLDISAHEWRYSFHLIIVGSYQCMLLIGCALRSLTVHEDSNIGGSLLYVFITYLAIFR